MDPLDQPFTVPQLDSEFRGQVALVTGAAGGGIGEAVVRRLASAGAAVAVTDRNALRAEAIARELRSDGAAATSHSLDISDVAQIDRVMAEVESGLGPPSILVNNAAVNVMGEIFEYEPDTFRSVIEADLLGPFRLIQLAARQMRALGGGAIVNVSSIAPEIGAADREPAYAAAKAAMNAIMRGVARAGGPAGIRCNAVTMVLVRGTRFVDQHHPELLDEFLQQIPLGAHPHAADIAEAVAFLASCRSRFINGAILDVTGGYWMRS